MTNDEVIAKFRKENSLWPNGYPETHSDRQLTEALDHLNKVLNGCQTAAEQFEIDTKAREFLLSCGR